MNVLRPILDGVITFVLKTFWPWFKKNAWPVLCRHILALFDGLITVFVTQLRNWFDERSESRSEHAEQMAREAEQKAAESEDAGEVDKHRAVAQVWRQVAEEFRRENEELKAKIEELSNDTQEAAATAVNLMNVDLALANGEHRIAINDKQYDLPPLLTDDSENDNEKQD